MDIGNHFCVDLLKFKYYTNGLLSQAQSQKKKMTLKYSEISDCALLTTRKMANWDYVGYTTYLLYFNVADSNQMK